MVKLSDRSGLVCSYARQRLTVTLLFLAVVVTLLSVLSGVAAAAEPYSLKETTTYSIDAVGTAHVTQALVYNESLWAASVDYFTQHPQMLRRDLEQQLALGSVKDFQSKTDAATRTITLTWVQPGFALNQDANWQIMGNDASAPDEVRGKEAIWRGSDPYYAAVTLYNEAETDWTYSYKVPAAATGLKWDDAEKKAVYTLAYVPPAPEGNVLQQNKWIFSALFGVLLAAGAVGLVLVLRRSRPRVTVVDAIPAQLAMATPVGIGGPPPAIGQGPPGLPATPEPEPPVRPTAEAQTPANVVAESQQTSPAPPGAATAVMDPAPAGSPEATATTEEPAAGANEHAHFCGHCGHQIHADEDFCPGCGKRVS